MKNLLKQLKKTSREVRLTTPERSTMRAALVRFVADHPAVVPALPGGVIRSPHSFLRRMRNFKTASFLVIGGVAIGGTVSFAAEGSIPGDILYPVKTEINERVRGVAAFTPQAKAGWEVKLVERRLLEIEELAALPEVSPEVEEAAQQNMKKYTERAQKRIEKFDDTRDGENALATAENLTGVLLAHEGILEHVDTKKSRERSPKDTDRAHTRPQETEDASPQSASGATSVVASSTTTRSSSSTLSNDSTLEEDSSLREVIDDIRETRKNVEKKNKALERAYRKEHQEEDDDRNEKEEREEHSSTPSSPDER